MSSEKQVPRSPPERQRPKRIRPSRRSTGNSSDPVYFSSDDLKESSRDNYLSPRRKRQVKRKWWEEEEEGEEEKDEDDGLISTNEPFRRGSTRRLSKRAKDSGIFMSSDGDSSGLEDGFDIEPIQASNRQNPVIFQGRPMPQPPAESASVDEALTGDNLVRHVVSKCLEASDAAVDLSFSLLRSISNDALRPLRDLITPPKALATSRVSEEQYKSFRPDLKLFLYSNQLKCVPGEITNLEYLTVLSLRNNAITELPHSIANLKFLKELNIAGNQIEWLPWEMLPLLGSSGALRTIQLSPNPFFSPFDQLQGTCRLVGGLEDLEDVIRKLEKDEKRTQDGVSRSPKKSRQRSQWVRKIYRVVLWRIRDWVTQWRAQPRSARSGAKFDERFDAACADARREPIFIASTAVSYLNHDGSVARGMPLPPSRLLGDQGESGDRRVLSTIGFPLASRPPGLGFSSAAPTLFESCLRVASKYVDFSELDDCLPLDMPETTLRALDLARVAAEQGGTRCSQCSAEYVSPRAEWVEYWHCGRDQADCPYDELFHPFLRRTCSWSCADNLYFERAANELELACSSSKFDDYERSFERITQDYIQICRTERASGRRHG